MLSKSLIGEEESEEKKMILWRGGVREIKQIRESKKTFLSHDEGRSLLG